LTTNWTLYTRKLRINGNTTKDRQINYMKDAIINNFSDSLSFRLAYFNGSTSTTNIQVVDNDEYYIKTILMEPDDIISVGDSIVFDNQTWLCIDTDKTNPVYQIGKAYLSTQTINLVKNNIIYNYPVVVDSNIRLYSMGYNNNKYIMTPDANIVVYVKNDNITSLLERGEIYDLSGDNYKIVDINRVTMSGLLILKMEYCIEDAETHIFTVNILNGSSMNIQQGDIIQLNVNVYDNGTLLSPTPSITYSSSNDEICAVNSEGTIAPIGIGSCVITASANGVSDSIAISVVEASTNNYTYTLTSISLPDTEIKIGQTKTYIAQKYNNGSAVSATFTFSVIGDVSAYEMVVVNSTTCTIKALKNGFDIVLRAVDSVEMDIVDKEISLKSIF
jgi:hypothetical protein